MAIQIQKPASDESEPWLISYADVVTLLLAFFITLLSTANMNKSRLESLAEVFGEARTKRTMTLPQIKEQVHILVLSSHLEEEVEVRLSDRGVEIQVVEKLLFERGKSELTLDSQRILARLSAIFASEGVRERRIMVEGHTDSLPIHTAQFASNWELSAARACEVVRFFIVAGVDPNRMEAVGYADTRPISPDTEENRRKGNPVNRRVVLVVS